MGWCSRYFRARDVRGLGTGDIETAELCIDVAEKLLKGMDDGKAYSAKDDAAELNSSSCSLSGTCSVPHNHNHFLPHRVPQIKENIKATKFNFPCAK